jgi:hypothetical protein
VPELPATDQGIRSLRLDRELARQGLPSDAAQVEYRAPKTPGLGLIFGRRTKTWSLTYATATGRRRTTLGRYPAVSLADARQAAEAKRAEARAGVDHQQAKRDYRAARTVEEVGLEYLEKAASQHASYRNYAWAIRNDVIPIIGKMNGVVAPTRSMLSVPKMALDRALPGVPRWRIHDLRRTCRTGMGKPARLSAP